MIILIGKQNFDHNPASTSLMVELSKFVLNLNNKGLLFQLRIFQRLYILCLKSNNNKCKCIKHYEFSYYSRKFKQNRMITRSSNQRSLRKKRQNPKKRQTQTFQKVGRTKKHPKNSLKKTKIIKKVTKKRAIRSLQKDKPSKIERKSPIILDKPSKTRSSSVRRSTRKTSINSNRQFVSNMIASSKLKCQIKRNKNHIQSKSKAKNNKISTTKYQKNGSYRLRKTSQTKVTSQTSSRLRSSTNKKEAKYSSRNSSIKRLNTQKRTKKEKIVKEKPKKILRKDIKLEQIDQNLTTSQMLDESAEKYRIIISKPKATKQDKSKSILALQTQKKIQSSRSFILSVEQTGKQWQIKVSQLKKKGQTITISPQGVTCSCINYRIHHTCENIQFLFDKVIKNPEIKEQILYRRYLGQTIFEQVSEQLKIILGFHLSERKSIKEHPLPNICLICFQQLESQASLSCKDCQRQYHKGCYEYFKFNCNHCPTCQRASIKLQNQQPLKQMEKLSI